VKSILSKAQFGKSSLGAQPGLRPPVAVEISPDGVLAAAAPSAGQPLVYAYAPLADGLIVPSIGEPNVLNTDALAAALRSVLGQVPSRSRAVTLVLPDTTIRVFVLDFETLSARPAEAMPVLRFRLRKTVPFEVEHAGISYQILSEKKDECRVLAAIIPGPVLSEYETAVRAAGYEPGAVLSSSLAALAGIDSLESVLVANLGRNTLTIMIANGNDLLLYRTVDLPLDPAQHAAEVQRNIAVAAAYYEDKLGARPTRLLYTGPESLDEFVRWIDDPELPVAELAARPDTGFVTSTGPLSIAGVAGALAGAR
jgi:type IV pilus assembly protein PilM